MKADLIQLVRLNLTRRIAARGLKRLVGEFGSIERALAAPEAALARTKGIGPETARALKEATEAAATAEIRRAEALGCTIVALGGEGYPLRLAEIYDPPLVLYVRGELREGENAVAVVGARRASRYGLDTAAALAKGLVRAGVTVVSGLARGIDRAAHEATLAAGGRTVAVLGSGIDRPYPPENDGLLEDIVRKGGAVVSEYPLGAPPLAFHFPRRNRLVSGLSLGIVVVEAAERSGSLITATWALEQGRDVMAVPGRVDDANSAGCLRLIQEGAALVRDAEEILGVLELAPPKDPRRRPAPAYDPVATPAGLTPIEERVYGALTTEPSHVDDVIDASGLPASTVFSTLTSLEIRRAVRSWPGKLYQRAS